MPGWIGRYEEGYVSIEGEVVTITDDLYTEHGWPSPEEAVTIWRQRRDLRNSSVTDYRNGLQQTDDVSERREFARWGIVRIWRRISFENDTAPTEA